MDMLLKTERLILRRPVSSDVSTYKEIHNSDFVLKYNPMSKKTDEEVLDEFNTTNMFVIELEEVIGAIFLSKDYLRYWDKSICLSYFLSSKYSNKGYMSEGLSAVIKYLFTQCEYEIITVRVFALNSASINLMKKLNFKQEGYLRMCVNHHNKVWDDVLFSLTKDEFFSK